MANYSDLIKVSFEDATSYGSIAGDDILGVVINHHWGPVNEVKVLDRASFFENYPESLPVGAEKVKVEDYYAYAQVKKAFELGISKVEVYRPQGEWKYVQAALSDEQFHTNLSDTQFGGAQYAITFALRYPGFIPKSLLGGDYDSLQISYMPGIETGDLIISLLGVKGGVKTTIESIEGSVNPSKVVDGNSYFIESRLEKSRFLRCKVFNEALPSDQLVIQLPSYTEDTASGLSIYDVENVLNNVYSDIEQSQSTFLISSCPTSDLDSLISNIASKRMNVNAIIGYPTSETFDKNSIESFHSNLIKDKFSIFVAAREMITVLGQKITSSCSGGWCGATAKVARDVRLNQMASARTYGTYSGLLCESLKFEDVLTLHEKGICSIYKAFTGPQIFGIRSLHPRQDSYFGKANVSRVLASLLRNIFPVVIDAIHTDAAANPITRASLSTQINFVIDSFISKQNLKDGSFADLSDEINTDVLTQGGKYLNIILSLRFIGLVESVNIKVIATDSSVTAEIV